jgi:hypothetical protein
MALCSVDGRSSVLNIEILNDGSRSPVSTPVEAILNSKNVRIQIFFIWEGGGKGVAII